MNPFERPGSGMPRPVEPLAAQPLPSQAFDAANSPVTSRTETAAPNSRTRPMDPTGFERRGFADQLSIETPEQVALLFPVAGIGSRGVALLLDHAIQIGVVLVVSLVVALIAAAMGTHIPSLAGKWFLAGTIFLGFLLFWGYFALFEAFWRGQTPGKRAMKLRVIKDAGRQITLFESLARNLLRVADYLPSLYLTGVITMLCNKRNKRLGDLAAGTIVVHERGDAQPLLHGAPHASSPLFPSSALTPDHREFAEPWRATPPAVAPFPADALARLSGHDLVVMETFFGRALDLPLETRAAMAYRIAAEMTTKMGVGLPEGNPERVIEAIAVGLRAQGRRY